MISLSESTQLVRTYTPLDQTIPSPIAKTSPTMTDPSQTTFFDTLSTNDTNSQSRLPSKNLSQIANNHPDNYQFSPSVTNCNEAPAFDTNTDTDDASGSRFYKTRRCLFHQRGACIKGSECTYAHSDDELKPTPDLVKTRLCQDWLNNICDSKTCKFAHGRHELRYTHDFYKTKICHFWHQGGCTKGTLCRHAHGQQEMRPQPINNDRDSSNQIIGGYTPSRDSTRSTSNSSPMWGSAEPNGARHNLGSHHFGHDNRYSVGKFMPTHESVTSKSEVLQALQLAEQAKRLAERSAALLARNNNDHSLERRFSNSACDHSKLTSLNGITSQFSPKYSAETVHLDQGHVVPAQGNTSNPIFNNERNHDNAKQTDFSQSAFKPQPAEEMMPSANKIRDISKLLAALPSILTDNELDLESFIELLDSSDSQSKTLQL